MDRLREGWEKNGIGWQTDTMPSKVEGCTNVILYYGSSTYSVDEMRTLLDWLVDQAQQMQIPIPLSKKDEEDLLERWGKK